MPVDPGQATGVEAAPGAGDGCTGQACLLVVDPAGSACAKRARRAAVDAGLQRVRERTEQARRLMSAAEEHMQQAREEHRQAENGQQEAEEHGRPAADDPARAAREARETARHVRRTTADTTWTAPDRQSAVPVLPPRPPPACLHADVRRALVQE